MAITRLLICKRHNEKKLIRTQLLALLQKYKPELMEYAITHRPSALVLESRLCQRNSKTSLGKKLRTCIKDNQFSTGFLYIYTWDSEPGYIKIGWPKKSSNERVKQ